MMEIFGIKKKEVNGEEKAFWTRIGVAFPSEDGSINCKFDYLPIAENITIQIREKKGELVYADKRRKTDFGPNHRK